MYTWCMYVFYVYMRQDERMDEDMGADFGSGYPGDPMVKPWMENNLQSTFGLPRVVIITLIS